MERLSGFLFSLGVIAMALAFAAHVANTVLLANGRRVLPAMAPRRQQPAFAGVVTGSFVERVGDAGGGPGLDRPASRIAPAAFVLTLVALALIGGSMALRAYLVGRGPWGNMFEFTVAFSFTMVAGYSLLERRYPIRSIGFLPVGVALGLLLYAASLPSDIKPLVPALENRPLLTIHVGMATIAYGIFATSMGGPVGPQPCCWSSVSGWTCGPTPVRSGSTACTPTAVCSRGAHAVPQRPAAADCVICKSLLPCALSPPNSRLYR